MTDAQLSEWNAQHKFGDRCSLCLDNSEVVPTRLRSEAWRLGGGHVVAMVEGHTGGWRLDRILFDERNAR